MRERKLIIIEQDYDRAGNFASVTNHTTLCNGGDLLGVANGSIMDTTTYASLAAIPWQVAESSRHRAVPEAEFMPFDLSYIAAQRAIRAASGVKLRASFRDSFLAPQGEEPMLDSRMSVIFTPTGPIVYSWRIDRPIRRGR